MTKPEYISRVLRILALTSFITAASAQEVTVPDPGLNAAIREALQKPAGPLTRQDMLQLTVLNAHDRNISSVVGLEAAENLNTLLLFSNDLTNFVFSSGLTNLVSLNLSGNPLKNVSLPAGATNLFSIVIVSTLLTNLTLPADLNRLEELDLQNNHFTSFDLPSAAIGLGVLDLGFNSLTNISLPGGLINLDMIRLSGNSLAHLTVPTGLTRLSQLYLDQNQLTSFTLPAGLTNLHVLDLFSNQLTSLNLPSDLRNLISLNLDNNRFTSLNLPVNLAGLAFLHLSGNQLTNITLSPDMTHLNSLTLDGNPLTSLVLSEQEASNLPGIIATLQSQDVPVFIYPLTVQLGPTREQPIGAFRFSIRGPPGDYTIFSSTNLSEWSVLGPSHVPLGAILITDTAAPFSPRKFYRVQLLQSPPANMVFVPASTFMQGSSTNEVGHRSDEGPQTIVKLSRGFWISKFLVTQADYLAVTGSNPSQFPGDLNRPVESASWFAASNYCVLLTQQDLAAGRISAGSRYRLPTEAEWECAARAGTSTRFYYGDDPGISGLTNHAWYGANSGFTTRPVGQKLPNNWGLYDMEGNVWEWCQDWYGNYSGGTVTDPQGPAFNAQGFKVIRGGAWEAFELDCRSARRSIEGASPFISDFIIGFRVVLAVDP